MALQTTQGGHEFMRLSNEDELRAATNSFVFLDRAVKSGEYEFGGDHLPNIWDAVRTEELVTVTRAEIKANAQEYLGISNDLSHYQGALDLYEENGGDRYLRLLKTGAELLLARDAKVYGVTGDPLDFSKVQHVHGPGYLPTLQGFAELEIKH